MRPLVITYLVESLTHLWGGVKTVCMEANRLHGAGHTVTIVTRSGPPQWIRIQCALRTGSSFDRSEIPPSDLVVGTFWNTVPYAVVSGRGVPVHYCQAYEGDNPELAAVRARIESVYSLGEADKIAISGHLKDLLWKRFAQRSRLVTYPVDHDVFRPEPTLRRAPRPVRVGLVGPSCVPWKDIQTGARAAELAHRAGLDLTLVRVSPVPFDATEPAVTCPVERHQQVLPEEMGRVLRSLDVFLGTSSGPEEGFFLPAMEAMASGVPSVLTEIPCLMGYTPAADYALFVPPRDPAQMAQALIIAATHDVVRAELRERGLAVARLHTWERHMAQLVAAFEGILGARGVVPRSSPHARV
jgi:glycosyltransferase involved in cell wall biosynthesis